MHIYDFIDYAKIIEFVFFFLIPLIILVKCYIRRRFMLAFELVYYFVAMFFMGILEGRFFIYLYFGAFMIFSIWWGKVYKKYKENNPKDYEAYKHYYSEYFSDDLNNDGIKDAFEHWEIAHDPRFFWLFGSRRAKYQRQLEESIQISEALGNSYGRGRYDPFNTFGRSQKTPEQQFNEWSASRKNGTYYRSMGSGETNYRSTDNRSYRNTAGGYAGNGYNNTSANNKNYGPKPESEMSDVEKEVAKQHAFARKYNLRYFAMCKSKTEAKKLYHKYATKFHPDNAVTGDKEKFMKIDEEYNRFCDIPEMK